MMMKMTTVAVAAWAVLAFSGATQAANLTFEFEGVGNWSDTTNTLSFTQTSGDVWTQITNATSGVAATNAVPYSGVADGNAITALNPVSGGTNEWFLRTDHRYISGDLEETLKVADGGQGVLTSDTFFVDATSLIDFEVAGGDNALLGVFLRNASDDSVIIDARRSGNGTGLQAKSWSSLVGSSTEVYVTIEDNNAGGWGQIAVDNLVLSNVIVPEPTSALLLVSMGAACLLLRRRR